MKSFFISLLFLSSLGLKASYQAKHVRIYIGNGVSPFCRQMWVYRLRNHLRQTTLLANFDSCFDFCEIIKTVQEKKNGLLVVPGGTALHIGLKFTIALEKEGLTKEEFLTSFKKNNWSYLGSCAGAYFAAESCSAELLNLDDNSDISFNSEKTENWTGLSFYRGHLHSLFKYKMPLKDARKAFAGAKALEVTGTHFPSMWIGGPNLNKLPGKKIFTDTEGNTLAVNLEIEEGKAPIILIVIHPEFTIGLVKKAHTLKGYPKEELEKHDISGEAESKLVETILSQFFGHEPPSGPSSQSLL